MDENIISERIHDAEPETNEAMVHWLHNFFNKTLTQEKLRAVFDQTYSEKKPIKFPWE